MFPRQSGRKGRKLLSVFHVCGARCRLSFVLMKNVAECQFVNVWFDDGNRMPALFVDAPNRLFGACFDSFYRPFRRENTFYSVPKAVDGRAVCRRLHAERWLIACRKAAFCRFFDFMFLHTLRMLRRNRMAVSWLSVHTCSCAFSPVGVLFLKSGSYKGFVGNHNVSISRNFMTNCYNLISQ